jgi:hypothetical protein
MDTVVLPKSISRLADEVVLFHANCKDLLRRFEDSNPLVLVVEVN